MGQQKRRFIANDGLTKGDDIKPVVMTLLLPLEVIIQTVSVSKVCHYQAVPYYCLIQAFAAIDMCSWAYDHHVYDHIRVKQTLV